MNPQVTIVVVPRDRFSYTRPSLESIYQNTQIPFELVYVDGNSPLEVHDYLSKQALDRSFRIIRTDTYLSPNQARNIGLKEVNTPYLVFVDNDVVVSPGWLKSLLQCAEETGADVVGPLMCQHEPVHQTIHCAGGESRIWTDKLGRRHMLEKTYRQGQQVSKVEGQLQRQVTDHAEFHCVLVRCSVFDKLGCLDEAMMNTKEHLDFSMSVRQAGGEVYFEPSSVVTFVEPGTIFVPGPPLQLTDVHFYMLRWSDAWTLKSLRRLQDKWNLAEDVYFKAKYKTVGWRRRVTLIEPLARKLTLGIGSRWVGKAIAKVEHLFNRFLTRRHRLQQKPFS